MLTHLRRLGILVVLIAVIALAIVLLAFSYAEIGITDKIGAEEFFLSTYDLSAVPQSVADDATELAEELFGDSQEKYKDFANQLLVTYIEAKDKDFIVVFNSGGWGWNLLETSPGWSSIINGMKSELENAGYKSVMLNYRRTSETVWGCIKEFVEVTNHYPSKARDLARRVEFFTAHIPEIRIIVAGESNGTVISDGVMNALQDNPQVYSIQTGPPFWHKSIIRDRTLVLDNNGTGPDAFSQGNITAMVYASVKNWLGSYQLEEEPGRILHYLVAPGHAYSWQYSEVSSQISKFLEENFGVKQ